MSAVRAGHEEPKPPQVRRFRGEPGGKLTFAESVRANLAPRERYLVEKGKARGGARLQKA